MTAFNRAWSMLKKQYTPPAGAERMPRPHPYGGDMPEGPDPLLRDPDALRADELINAMTRQTIPVHGPLPRHIPRRDGKYTQEPQRKTLSKYPDPLYYTAEHAPDEYYYGHGDKEFEKPLDPPFDIENFDDEGL